MDGLWWEIWLGVGVGLRGVIWLAGAGVGIGWVEGNLILRFDWEDDELDVDLEVSLVVVPYEEVGLGLV